MQARSFVSWSIRLSVTILLLAGSTWAQFTGNVQGTVADPSGAAVAQAKVTLINVATQVSATTTTDASGSYRFLSLAPGSYKITVEETLVFQAGYFGIHLTEERLVELLSSDSADRFSSPYLECHAQGGVTPLGPEQGGARRGFSKAWASDASRSPSAPNPTASSTTTVFLQLTIFADQQCTGEASVHVEL